MKYYIGIDPGLTGAACLIRSPEIIIIDWDGVVNTSQKIWGYQSEIIGAYIEYVKPIPKDKKHLTSLGKLIRNAGQWEGILSAFEITVKQITPQQWRKGIYLPSDRSPLKKRSLDAARRLFPDYAETYFKREKDHNRAEAALIAYQCERYFHLTR